MPGSAPDRPKIRRRCLQERKPAYLKAGDVVTASIATEDRTLDLGTQRTVVRDPAP